MPGQVNVGKSPYYGLLVCYRASVKCKRSIRVLPNKAIKVRYEISGGSNGEYLAIESKLDRVI